MAVIAREHESISSVPRVQMLFVTLDRLILMLTKYEHAFLDEKALLSVSYHYHIRRDLY